MVDLWYATHATEPDKPPAALDWAAMVTPAPPVEKPSEAEVDRAREVLARYSSIPGERPPAL